jgi:uncharacterized protein (TIGR02246 family)
MSELAKLVDDITAAWNDHDSAQFAAQFSEDGVLRVIATGEVVRGRQEFQSER